MAALTKNNLNAQKLINNTSIKIVNQGARPKAKIPNFQELNMRKIPQPKTKEKDSTQVHNQLDELAGATQDDQYYHEIAKQMSNTDNLYFCRKTGIARLRPDSTERRYEDRGRNRHRQEQQNNGGNAFVTRETGNRNVEEGTLRQRLEMLEEQVMRNNREIRLPQQDLPPVENLSQ